MTKLNVRERRARPPVGSGVRRKSRFRRYAASDISRALAALATLRLPRLRTRSGALARSGLGCQALLQQAHQVHDLLAWARLGLGTVGFDDGVSLAGLDLALHQRQHLIAILVLVA